TVGLKKDKMFGSESFPPKNGPIIKPNPKAAPIKPKFLARSFGAVKSAIEAWATEIFPLENPPNALAKKSNGMFLIDMAKANKAYEVAVKNNVYCKIGFLPNL